MGFLDASGITTLVTKLKERFLLRGELKTVNNESLIGSGDIRGENRTFVWYIGSTYINPTSFNVSMNNPDRCDFEYSGGGLILDSGKKYEIVMGAHANGENMSVSWGITLSSGTTSSLNLVVPANGYVLRNMVLTSTKKMSAYLTVTKSSTTSRTIQDVFCKVHEL